VPTLGRWLRRVLEGYDNYHGVAYNYASLAKLYFDVARMGRDVLGPVNTSCDRRGGACVLQGKAP